MSGDPRYTFTVTVLIKRRKISRRTCGMGTEEKRQKSLVCTHIGDPSSNLDVVYTPSSQRRTCPPTSVRIKVCAASINFADMLQIAGLYQEKKTCPFVPGSEASGWILELGKDVPSSSGLSIGDAVCALTSHGAFQEEAFALSSGVVKIPATSDVTSAAGLPVAFGTAYMGLSDSGIGPHKTVLILGASGGVGSAAVQLSHVMGATVICITRGRDKVEFLKNVLGVDICIDSQGLSMQEIQKEVKTYAPNGVDIVFDPVGGALGLLAFKSLTTFGGHVVIVGFASGTIQEYKANIALVKNITLHGLYWGAHMVRDQASFRRSLDAVAQYFAQGDIFVPVCRVYSFEEAREAFKMLQKRSVQGKLLLVPTIPSML